MCSAWCALWEQISLTEVLLVFSVGKEVAAVAGFYSVLILTCRVLAVLGNDLSFQDAVSHMVFAL